MKTPHILFVLILNLCFNFQTFARGRYFTPLMPSKSSNSRYEIAYQKKSTNGDLQSYKSTNNNKRERSYGLELGFLSRRNSSEEGTLGMQWLIGGRIVIDYPYKTRFHIKPSFGYFFRSEGEANTKVSEHNFELGASLLYQLFPNKKTDLLIGVSNRLDGLISSLRVLNSSETTPLSFRYRVGPCAQLSTPFMKESKLTLGIEVPFEVPDFRAFSSLTLGFLTAF